MSTLSSLKSILETGYSNSDIRVLLWLIFSDGENPTQADLLKAFEHTNVAVLDVLSSLEHSSPSRLGLIRGLKPRWDVLGIDPQKIRALGTVAPMVMMKQLRAAVATALLKSAWHSSDLIEFNRLLKKYPVQKIGKAHA